MLPPVKWGASFRFHSTLMQPFTHRLCSVCTHSSAERHKKCAKRNISKIHSFLVIRYEFALINVVWHWFWAFEQFDRCSFELILTPMIIRFINIKSKSRVGLVSIFRVLSGITFVESHGENGNVFISKVIFMNFHC